MSAEKVLQTLQAASKPMKAGEIAEVSGLDKAVVEKAMKELKASNKIESPIRCFWAPAKN